MTIATVEQLNSAALSELLRDYGRVQIPVGSHTLSQSLELTYVNGVGLYGLSHRYDSPDSPGWQDKSPLFHLHFDIPAGVPAIRLRYATGCEFERFSVSRSSAGPLFQVESPAGWGSAYNRWFRVALFDLAGHAQRSVQGIRMGTAEGEHNNDTSVISNCLFHGLDECLVTENIQSVAHDLDSNHANFCRVVVRANRGGDIHLSGGATFRVQKLFEVTGGGDNTASFSLDGVRIDSDQEPHQVRLIDASEANPFSTIRFHAQNCTLRATANYSPWALVVPPTATPNQFRASGAGMNTHKGHLWMAS